MGGIVKLITGKAGTKSAKISAAATTKAATEEATANRVAAQGVQRAQETLLAQQAASRRASEITSVPLEQAEVDLAPDTPDAEIDPETGRRRTARSSFMSPTRSTAGINI